MTACTGTGNDRQEAGSDPTIEATQETAPTLADPADPTYYHKMVVLGDSIAHGYGLSDLENTRYSALIEARMQLLPCAFESYNLAVDGATSTDMLELLSGGIPQLAGADLVVISIGANNILRVSAPLLEQYINGNRQEVLTLLSSDKFKADLQSGIEQLNADIPVIIDRIKESAPNADILFQTVYNPFKGARISYSIGNEIQTMSFGDEIGVYVEQLNAHIRENAASNGYSVADVYNAFENSDENLVNVVLGVNSSMTNEVDPHPNANGHVAIADVITETLRTLGRHIPE